MRLDFLVIRVKCSKICISTSGRPARNVVDKQYLSKLHIWVFSSSLLIENGLLGLYSTWSSLMNFLTWHDPFCKAFEMSALVMGEMLLIKTRPSVFRHNCFIFWVCLSSIGRCLAYCKTWHEIYWLFPGLLLHRIPAYFRDVGTKRCNPHIRLPASFPDVRLSPQLSVSRRDCYFIKLFFYCLEIDRQERDQIMVLDRLCWLRQQLKCVMAIAMSSSSNAHAYKR